MSQYLIVYFLGVLFGGVSMKLLNLHKRSGNIIVQHDEDGVYLSLQLKSIDDITSKKEVTLGVGTRN